MMKHTSNVVKANDEVVGVEVKNNADEHLGKIKEVMLDKISGRVAYVVLDSGSFLGMGGKFFALPWSSLHYGEDSDCFKVDIDKERLKNAPGFDKDNWPDMADRTWGESISTYYGTKPYWE
jgi:sporulation protein YlmC with PRC-barrel domain